MSRNFRMFVFVLSAFFVINAGCTKDMGSGKITGAGGSTARFAIVGNYLYIVDHSNLDVYDINDASKPQFRKTVGVGMEIETIFPFNDKLYMGSTSGMYIFSITQPENPVPEGSVYHFRACDPVVTNDSMAYVTLNNSSSCGATGKNALHVYDVRDANKPKLVTEVIMDNPGGLGIRQNALYVCQGNKGMLVFDLTHPTKPKAVKQFKDENYSDVIPYGNLLIAYIDKGVSFFDISNPINPVLLSQVKG